MNNKISVKQLTAQEIAAKGIRAWPIWEKEVSKFDWHYSNTEECLLLEGEVEVITQEGSTKFTAGDFVTLAQGLSCTWVITKPVKKHYNFI